MNCSLVPLRSCASSTMEMMREIVFSANVRVARTSSAPGPLMLPANTVAPGPFSTGTLSPVTGASFIPDSPETISPSVTTGSPGRMTKISPTVRASAGISTSFPSRRTRAVFGVKSINARIAERVFSSVYPSSASEME